MSAIPPEDIENFWQHVAALEAEHGVELTPEGQKALAEYVGENGFHPDVTRDGFAALAAEAETGADAESVDLSAYEQPSYELPPYGPAPDAEPSAEVEEQFQADISADLERLQKRLDRSLTARELAGIEERMGTNMRRFGSFGLDVDSAYDEYAKEAGVKPPDEWTMSDRIQHATERFREGRADADKSEDDTPIDLDTHQGRVDYAMHKLNGGEFEEVGPEE